MKQPKKELTPVAYSAAAVGGRHHQSEQEKVCFRMHWHDRLELLRIQRGGLRVTCGGKEWIAKAGAVVVIPPRMPHYGQSLPGGVEFDVVMFDLQRFYNQIEICQSLLPALFDGRAALLPITHHSEIVACMDFLAAHRQEGSLRVMVEVYRLLDLLLTHCFLEMRAEVRQETVRRIIDYMEEHYGEDLDTEILCRVFNYSSTHLCRKFKESTGLTPMRYLRIYRLEEAKKQLRSSEGTVGEIAARCGFSDANYFTRCFKQHFGAAPTSMRK